MDIFKNLLNIILNQDIQEFKKIISENNYLLNMKYKDIYLIHYLFHNYWNKGIDYYRSINGNMNLLTDDVILSLRGIPLYITAGQNGLHLLAERDKEMYHKVKLKYKYLQIPDINGDTPEKLSKIDSKIYRKNYQKILKRNENKFCNVIPYEVPTINLSSNIKKFTLDIKLIMKIKKKIKNIKVKIPNSMHRYGKIIYPKLKSIIDKLVIGLLPNMNIISIYAFYIKYDNKVQKKLDIHRDNSTWTINICLSNNLSDGKLVFVKSGIVYSHTSNDGIFHRGSLEHYVDKVNSKGNRENIIIWVKSINKKK